jgi:PAS domain-containing protein
MTARDRAPSRGSSQLARLHALTRSLADALGADAVADAIVDHVLPALGAEAGVVALLDADEMLTVIRVSGALTGAVHEGQRLPLATTTALSEAVRRAAVLIFESREARLARFPGMADAEQRSEIAVGAAVALPLLAGTRAIGALGITFAADRSFTDDERTFLDIVAQQCGQALDRARRFDDAQREIAARTTVEAELRETQRRTEAILAGIGDAFFALDRDWRYIYVNDAAAALQGVRAEDLLGRVIWEASPRAPLTPFAAAARRAMTEGVPVRDEHLSPVDGSW